MYRLEEGTADRLSVLERGSKLEAGDGGKRSRIERGITRRFRDPGGIRQQRAGGVCIEPQHDLPLDAAGVEGCRVLDRGLGIDHDRRVVALPGGGGVLGKPDGGVFGSAAGCACDSNCNAEAQ